MSDSDRSPRGRSDETTDFAEWLALTADARGVSRQELLEEIISSYWTMEEMSEIMQESEEPEATAEQVSRGHTPLTRSTFEAFQAEIDDRFDALEESFETLESRVDGEVSPAELEQRLDNEFAALKRILEHLISSVKRTEEALESVDDELEQEFKDLRRERSRLYSLKLQAMRKGIDAAECDYCETDIDLALLPTPFCPGCGRSFTDVRRRKEFLGMGIGSHILASEEPQRDRSGPSRLDDAAPSAREGGVSDMVWDEDL